MARLHFKKKKEKKSSLNKIKFICRFHTRFEVGLSAFFIFYCFFFSSCCSLFLHCWLGTNRGVHCSLWPGGGAAVRSPVLIVHVLVSKICNNLLHQVHVFT